jgi:hypothetical protein
MAVTTETQFPVITIPEQDTEEKREDFPNLYDFDLALEEADRRATRFKVLDLDVEFDPDMLTLDIGQGDQDMTEQSSLDAQYADYLPLFESFARQHGISDYSQITLEFLEQVSARQQEINQQDPAIRDRKRMTPEQFTDEVKKATDLIQKLALSR